MNVKSILLSGMALNFMTIKNARKAWMVVHVLSAKTVYQPFQMASNRWADTPSGYKSAINGCLKHSSDTACDVCEEGSIKTTDNKCYTNYGRSRSLYYYSGDSNYE